MTKKKNESVPSAQSEPVSPDLTAVETAAPETPPGDTGQQLSPEEFEAYLKECVKAATERDEYKDKYIRLAAEYDNYRKRTQKERENLYIDAQAATVEKFLPVYDNLERALAQPTQDTAYQKGVELIMKGLVDIFEKLNVHGIDALGQPFDPAVHDAVMHIEDDSGEQNMVAEVFQNGFTIGERVIRHAMVKVKN